jgi:hypothetical protein
MSIKTITFRLLAGSALLLTLLLVLFAVTLPIIHRWGETVALPRLDNTYGILALVLGRGFHGLVGLLPMLVGAAYGTRLAAQFPADEVAKLRTSGRISRYLGTAVYCAD